MKQVTKAPNKTIAEGDPSFSHQDKDGREGNEG